MTNTMGSPRPLPFQVSSVEACLNAPFAFCARLASLIRRINVPNIEICVVGPVRWQPCYPPRTSPQPRRQRAGAVAAGVSAALRQFPIPSPTTASSPRTPRPPRASSSVHQIKERYYYEIPKTELGKDFLWNSQIAKTTAGVGYGGGQLTRPGDPLGAEGQSRPPAGGQLQPYRRSQLADRAWP